MQVIVYIAVLTALLVVLYLFQRQIINYFSLISFVLFGTSKVGVYVYFFFFLPGVIFHELAHLFMASVLGVPTGNLTLFPRQEKEGWTLGKVSSAETDVLRSGLIGLAPMIIGISSLVVIGNVVLGIKIPPEIVLSRPLWQNIILFYLILAFSNTMFLSRDDRTSIWAIPTLIIFLFFLSQAMGWIGLLTTIGDLVIKIILPLILSFALTAFVDFLFLLLLALFAGILLRLKR